MLGSRSSSPNEQRASCQVGDSGEKDPEIYAELARKHPRQIAHVLIRALPKDSRCGEAGGQACAEDPTEAGLAERGSGDGDDTAAAPFIGTRKSLVDAFEGLYGRWTAFESPSELEEHCRNLNLLAPLDE